MKKLTCIDLFCGCGGFSLGMQRAGFKVLAAIDFNAEAIAVFRKNFPDVRHALHEDLTAFPPESLAKLLNGPVVSPLPVVAEDRVRGCCVPSPLGGEDRVRDGAAAAVVSPRPSGEGRVREREAVEVDVIVGGPPCQGFSTVRQRDGANSGPRMINDQRRHLYAEFLRYVAHFRPKVFVMENVLGIKSAAGGEYFKRVQQEARAIGYRVHPQVERAAELGVPQKRARQLIIGMRDDLSAILN